MARSSLLAGSRRLALVLAALACGGCDLVIGLSDDAHPCGTSSFIGQPTALTPADAFSIDWDERVAVLVVNGLPATYQLKDRTQSPLDLGAYVDTALSLSPEGDGLFFTAMIEPPTLMAAGLEKATWRTGQRVPKGTFAGTPSADVFGPRRVLVRLRDGSPTVQEYEDQGGVWVAIGDPHDLPGAAAPNLTPNGLTMVYAGTADTPGVFEATRTSTATWFDDPQLVLAGDHTAPQLLGRCRNLYVLDSEMLARYER